MTETVDVTQQCPVKDPQQCKFSITYHYDKKIADEVGITPTSKDAKKQARQQLLAAHEAGKHERHGIRAFKGQMIRKGAEVIMIFKVKNKYYPATQHNREIMDGYLHTGAIAFLDQLTDEVEL